MRPTRCPTTSSAPREAAGTRIGIMAHATLGGSVRVATHLAASLAARGHAVVVLSLARPSFPLPPTVTVCSVRDDVPEAGEALAVRPGADAVAALVDLAVSAVDRHGIELLHYHYGLPFAEVAARVRVARPGLAVVGTLHGTEVSLHASRELAGWLAPADALTTVSPSHAALVRARLGLDTVVIPDFVDARRFRPRPAGAGRPGRPRVLHVSNFRPVKNTAAVARSFAALRERRPAELWLVGDGATRAATTADLRRRGVPRSAVRCFGAVDDPAPIVARGDVMLVPSHAESFSLVALEALACGVPVVGSRVGGLRDLLDGHGCGLLVDPDDDDGVADALARVLDDRPALAAAARRRARDFAVDRVVPRYQALYRTVLAGEHAPDHAPPAVVP